MTSEIFAAEASALSDSREHAWPNLFTFVECEHHIGPAFPGQSTVGSGLPLQPIRAANTRFALVLGHSLMRL